jgi:hypothetical protein
MSALQQKVFLYVKWFHKILNEFIDCSEQNLVRKEMNTLV